MYEYLVTKKHIEMAEREVHVLVYGYHEFSQYPPYRASRSRGTKISRIAVAGTSFSPLPCRVEVEVTWLPAPTAWR
jgi:hypothetical protein